MNIGLSLLVVLMNTNVQDVIYLLPTIPECKDGQNVSHCQFVKLKTTKSEPITEKVSACKHFSLVCTFGAVKKRKILISKILGLILSWNFRFQNLGKMIKYIESWKLQLFVAAETKKRGLKKEIWDSTTWNFESSKQILWFYWPSIAHILKHTALQRNLSSDVFRSKNGFQIEPATLYIQPRLQNCFHSVLYEG